MAWVTMISKAGTKLQVPEEVYKNMFKGNESYSILEESKPSPKLEEKKQEEVVVNEPTIQKPARPEGQSDRKSTKKTIS